MDDVTLNKGVLYSFQSAVHAHRSPVVLARLKAGLCVRCAEAPINPADPAYSLCVKHQEEHRAWRRQYDKQKRAEAKASMPEVAPRPPLTKDTASRGHAGQIAARARIAERRAKGLPSRFTVEEVLNKWLSGKNLTPAQRKRLLHAYRGRFTPDMIEQRARNRVSMGLSKGARTGTPFRGRGAEGWATAPVKREPARAIGGAPAVAVNEGEPRALLSVTRKDLDDVFALMHALRVLGIALSDVPRLLGESRAGHSAEKERMKALEREVAAARTELIDARNVCDALRQRAVTAEERAMAYAQDIDRLTAPPPRKPETTGKPSMSLNDGAKAWGGGL